MLFAEPDEDLGRVQRGLSVGAGGFEQAPVYVYARRRRRVPSSISERLVHQLLRAPNLA